MALGLFADTRQAFSQLAGDETAFAGRTAHHELRGRLVAVFVVSIAIDALVTAGVHKWDGLDLGHSFVWTTSELLTGGAGLAPSAFATHYVELFLQAWAVTAIAVLAGSFGAFFHRLHLERLRRDEASTFH